MQHRKTNHRLLVVSLAVSALCLSAFSAQASTTDPLIEGAKLCTRQLPRFEKEYGIPKHLLSAIASTESGRYHEGLKIRIPWPWTVNAAGKGYYFDSKEEAVAAVKKFLARRVQSIDVGCMQVNIYHHPEAFSSLEDAFEPKNNIAYAASFLRDLYQEEHSWKRAAADYHSKEPVRGSQYVGQVYDSWQKLVDKLQTAQLKVPASSLAVMRDMRPVSSGTKYATLIEPGTSKKTVFSPAVQKVVSYRSPHTREITVRKQQEAPRNSGVIVVQPEIQTAAVPIASNPGIIPISSQQPVTIMARSGPNFIFSD